MATIPIEVILQDADVPVDPTPTPEQETDISVPETGIISNGNGGGSIESAASIILPAIIAVLAIGAVVAMILNKHRKHTNSAMSRKEKLATAASGTIAILAATVLVGNLVIPATNAATDNAANNDEGELVVDDKITITITREAGSDSAVIANVDNVSYATVTKPFGYEIAVSMASDNSNLYLDGDETSEYYFSPVEDGVLENNTWGYTLDGEEYNAVPLVGDFAVVASGNTAVSDEEINVQYGIKVSSDMPVGTYAGELEYTLSDTGFPLSLRTMQDMTTEICDSVPTPEAFKTDGATIEDIVPTVMLPDARDNKLYRIAKLADGKCWMTQNLDLQKEDLLAGVVLNDSNTDHPATSFTLPTSQISGNDSWGDSSGQTDIETTHVYDIAASGNTYKYCIVMQYGSCIEYGDEIPAAELGNLYNWYTATAGTGTQATGSGGENPYEATGSICPADWRLPNSSNNSEATDYSTLLSLYGITENPTSSTYISTDATAIYKAPLSLVPSGSYSGGLSGVGGYGYLWSSLAYSSRYAKFFYFIAGYVGPWSDADKTLGQAVRCLAR